MKTKSRQSFIDFFIKIMKPDQHTSILDLGGSSGELMAMITNRINCKLKIVIADIDEKNLFIASNKYNFETYLINEFNGLSSIDSNSYDIVFCNAVLEHVTLSKSVCINEKIPQKIWQSSSLKAQTLFANEIRRIGNCFFVRTPHKDFPIESHTWLPFVNWLNHNNTMKLVFFLDKYWVKKCGYVDWNLLRSKDVKLMFPEARIWEEKILGIPKHIIAYYVQ